MSGLLYFDCFSGIAGDMTTAALLSLSGAEKELRKALKGLPLSGYRLAVERGTSGGVAGTRVGVNVSGRQAHGRHLPEIVALLRASSLPGDVRARAISCFERLGDAEAKVHGTTVDKVHFHEVGAVDAIVDIVSGCF
ncbi:MAG: nickel insertion protein, partial [Desulfobacteria bacterium]